MILKLLHLLQVQQLFACYQLQFPRQNPSDLEVILVIGGKRVYRIAMNSLSLY